MMVHAGLADGMVSGCVTPPRTRSGRPSRWCAPRRASRSSRRVFIMCLADRVLVYGDCAVNPDPTAEQLADIAISSAAHRRSGSASSRAWRCCPTRRGRPAPAPTSRRCAPQPRWSASGRRELLGRGSDPVRRGRRPAWRATKLKDSPVAGRATVLVFPDLNTGNNTYKAVQRSADAVAIGPGAAGPEQAGQRPVARRARARHRQHRRHHRGAGAGQRSERRPHVLVVNAGSSSLKYQLIDADERATVAVGPGRADRRGSRHLPRGSAARPRAPTRRSTAPTTAPPSRLSRAALGRARPATRRRRPRRGRATASCTVATLHRARRRRRRRRRPPCARSPARPAAQPGQHRGHRARPRARSPASRTSPCSTPASTARCRRRPTRMPCRARGATSITCAATASTARSHA